MNLKYYLRGLGLGILVTALILGLAGTKKKRMSDEEIIARAQELGMIENTVLTQVPDQESGEPEDTADEAGEAEAAGEAAAEAESKELEEPAEPEAEEPPSGPADETEETPEDVEEAQEESQPDETETVSPEEKSEESGTGAAPADPEPEEPAQAAQDGNAVTGAENVFVLTVVQGDSSYSVAKKMCDMGLVSSAEEYDRFLCQNGYDRGIRAGMYEIKGDMTEEEIARLINGK